MGPVTDKVATAESLPQETKIAIIGGGIIGVSTALFRPSAAFPSLFLKRERLLANSPAVTGAGAAAQAVTAAKCRSSSRACGYGMA